jgi:hypothetical protein
MNSHSKVSKGPWIYFSIGPDVWIARSTDGVFLRSNENLCGLMNDLRAAFFPQFGWRIVQSYPYCTTSPREPMMEELDGVDNKFYRKEDWNASEVK